MGQSELGLPLEYTTLHEYYDLLSAGDHDAKNDLIENILRKHKVESVLDLTCGTGSQVFWLAKRSYKVTGSDFSPALLKIAKDKAEKEKLDVRLIDGDMRTIHVGNFDAVITIFNAIGHLTKTDFEISLKNIHRNLKKGGLYVFDILNLDAMTDQAVKNLSMDIQKTINETKIRNIQHSELDRASGRLTSHDQFIIQEPHKEPKLINDKFTLQIYTASEIRKLLTKNGFETLDQISLDGSPLKESTTTNILTIAKSI